MQKEKVLKKMTSKLLIFAAGVAVGAAGLCWAIQRFTAGIEWYAPAKMDPDKMKKPSITIWTDNEPGEIAEKVYQITTEDELAEVITELQEYYELERENL